MTFTVKTAKCQNCGMTIRNDFTNATKLELRDRGGRTAYLCSNCSNKWSLMRSYSTENVAVRGSGNRFNDSISYELETSYTSKTAWIELTHHNFLATSDCTVDIEFKTPIYNGKKALVKKARTVADLMESGDIEIGSNCGTHVHVGTMGNSGALNPTTHEYIRRFYHSLYVPLSDYLVEHPRECKKVFGRSLEDYSYFQPIHRNSDVLNHSNFINMEHNTESCCTIEYRVCKFVNYRQFCNMVHMVVDMNHIVYTNFIEHFNDTPKTGTQTEYRKHKADVTAKKLVKCFQKYLANLD